MIPSVKQLQSLVERFDCTKSVREVSDFIKVSLHVATLNLHACVNFFPPVNNVSWWKSLFELGSVQCSRRIYIMSSIVWNRFNFNNLLSLGNSQKSQRAIPGECAKLEESGFSPKNVAPPSAASTWVSPPLSSWPNLRSEWNVPNKCWCLPQFLE